MDDSVFPVEDTENLIRKSRQVRINLDLVKEVLPETGFTPEGFGEEIRESRYAHLKDNGESETWEEQCRRVAKYVAQDEEEDRWEEVFYYLLVNGYVSPGGRIWANAASENHMVENCFTVGSVEDSKQGWSKMAYNLIMISSLGAGWGADLSEIRPEGTTIRGNGGESKAGGPEDVMKLADGNADVVRGAGNRRAALWMGLDIRHPDIDWFIKSKRDNDLMQNMNVSVSFIDDCPSEFFEVVEEGDTWETKWEHEDDGREVVEEKDAQELWETWLNCMINPGDPAIMNFKKVNERYNCRYLDENIVSCNACSEAVMLPYETCTLSNLVIPRFFETVQREEGETPLFDFNAFGFVLATRIQTRLLDNLIEVQDYIDEIPEHEQRKKNLRRIGNGFMGLAEALVLFGHRYSTEAGKMLSEKLTRLMTLSAYDASVCLAEERGKFKKYRDDFLQEGTFASKLPAWAKKRIRENGIRNSILTNVPPTGTTSLVQGVTGGLEPVYHRAYKRTYVDGETDEKKEEIVINNLYEHFVEQGYDTSVFENGVDIDPEDQLEALHGIQTWVDSNTSKTVLIPRDFEDEDIGELVKEWAPKLISFTFYQLGSRDEQPITPMSEEETMKHLGENREEIGVEVDCEDGKCDL